MTWRIGFVSGAAVVLVGVLVGGRYVSPIRDIPVGTGYAAQELCSRTWQMGQAFEQVRERYVKPKVQQLPSIWEVERRAGERVTVSTRLPTLEHRRTAVYREGLGCTMLPPGPEPIAKREARLRGQAFRAAVPAEAREGAWPLGEGAPEREQMPAGWESVLKRHEAKVFDGPPGAATQTHTTALLVAQGGHLVYERYGEGLRRDQPQLGWSMTKTLTALLAGVMASDGKVSLDAPVGLPRWEGTKKASITWAQLLSMAPGLKWFEGYGGKSDATEMLFSRANQGAYAADLPLVAEPGTEFTYSTGTSNIAMLRMRQLAGDDLQSIYDYYQTRLFRPLGIRDGVIEPDAHGTPVGGARGFLRPVDWLRLGQLMLDEGDWAGETVVPADFIAYMKAASPANAGYGGSIWRKPSERVPAAQRARLPDDLVYMAGHLGQYVVIVPSRQLLVLRMGVAFEGLRARKRVFALVIDLLEAEASRR